MPVSLRGRTHAAACLIALLLPGICSASVSIYVAPETLAQRAGMVVEATVTRTASGLDPESATISTYVDLEVLAVHRGPADLDRLTIREAGGSFAGLVNEVDAVPLYVPGEHVLVFLEPGPDGALRTADLFYGKYVVDDSNRRGPRLARRELGGRGRILRGPAGRTEEVRLSDLVALTRSTPPPASEPWSARPPETPRLIWDDVHRLTTPDGDGPTDDGSIGALDRRPANESAAPRWTLLSTTDPTRWFQPDTDTTIVVNVQRDGAPLPDPVSAVDQIRRATDAWTAVPESRLDLDIADDDYDYTGSHSQSPAAAYTGVNVVLFDDPYENISDPSGCSGVLAIGGYWRSGATGQPVNDVTFHPALQLYVIFNNAFECFLGDPDNLAEVAAHELGHGLGFGHSTAPDAIMRATAQGFRGPRLGDDDRDAAHCAYPHELTVTTPDGAESWTAGELRTIAWNASEERGPDAGEVDLDYSTDGGETWQPIVAGTPNDGAYSWLVPDEPTAAARVRVLRRTRAGDTPSLFPDACSGDFSDADFSILAATIVAGAIDSDPRNGGLRVDLEPDGELRLSWGPSCSSDVDNHAIYEGRLSTLREGQWDHQPLVCDAGADLVEYVVPGAGDRYYLVAPSAGGQEGHLGRGSDSAFRPPSALACRPREEPFVCK